MKKNVLLAAGLVVLVLSGCGSSQTNSVTNGSQTSQEELNEQALNELNQMIQDEIDAREAEQEEIQNQAEQQNEYVEGIIPAGRYYKEGDTSNTCWTFYTDTDGVGCFLINDKSTIGTYTYNPETGIYSIEYIEGIGEAVSHFVYEGYYREEDLCFVRTKSATIVDDEEYILSDEEAEFYKILE